MSFAEGLPDPRYEGMTPLLPDLVIVQEENPYTAFSCEDLRDAIRELEDDLPHKAQQGGVEVLEWTDEKDVLRALSSEFDLLELYRELLMMDEAFYGFGSDEDCACRACKDLKVQI